MHTAPAAHAVTRDAILFASNGIRFNQSGDAAISDTHVHYPILDRRTAGDTEVYATVSTVFGQRVVRIVRTGAKLDRHDTIRVRIEFAQDSGDVAGTIVFGHRGNGPEGYALESIGGRAPARWFAGFGWLGGFPTK